MQLNDDENNENLLKFYFNTITIIQDSEWVNVFNSIETIEEY